MKNKKELFEAATNAKEGMITNDKIKIDNWVLKDGDDDKKDNSPSNVKEFVNGIIEFEILQKHEEIPFKIVTKNENEIAKNSEIEEINFNDILTEDIYETPNMDTLNKEENNLFQIMNTLEQNKKEDKAKMKANINLKRKYHKIKSKIPIK